MDKEILKSGYGDYIAVVTTDENKKITGQIIQIHKNRPVNAKVLDTEEGRWYNCVVRWDGSETSVNIKCYKFTF